jgi:hypothetical protein
MDTVPTTEEFKEELAAVTDKIKTGSGSGAGGGNGTNWAAIG